MLKLCVFLALSFVACHGAPNKASGTFCGLTPNNMFKCLNNPRVLNLEAAAKCTSQVTECEKITCVFREQKWSKHGVIDKAKIRAHFEQYETEHPEWAPAVQHVKAFCLAPELRAQGVFLNCPAYDIMQCALASFIKHASPSVWSTEQNCDYPKAYAADCPVCPSDCYSAAIPIGSCNACYLQPRTV
uniref:Odorant binding protein 18 n=1 Tax=Spodoptera exigua TaxID=7107 RepID=A0A0K1DD01_SPOEX|nr:odorant binding protein 18 [Spodoptera exigua]